MNGGKEEPDGERPALKGILISLAELINHISIIFNFRIKILDAINILNIY